MKGNKSPKRNGKYDEQYKIPYKKDYAIIESKLSLPLPSSSSSSVGEKVGSILSNDNAIEKRNVKEAAENDEEDDEDMLVNDSRALEYR